ncbi:MAG TPA: CPBP family intramembrane glutamic endopeptidase [Anaerolineales bacterium]|nr:CPBP family intramembrane glutamic endopeptidase [Anaerolineales bacterium]
MISLLILIFVAAIILITSFRRVPGIGVVIALAIIGLLIWLRGDGLMGLGFFPPENWGMTILWSFLLGVAIQFGSTLLLEPFSDKVTNSRTDHSLFESLRGNLKNFLLLLVAVWVLVACLEEIIFRGYMMGDIAELFGTSKPALAVNLILTSILFGLAHWYQGRSGALSTGIIGAVLGILFITSGFNLWLPVLTHGFIDTIGLFLIYINADKFLKERVKILA